MTNEEMIEELLSRKVSMSMCISVDDCRKSNMAIEKAVEALKENTKLKTEIERLSGELKSEREWRYNTRIELLDRNKEIELLKEEIESRKIAGIKNNNDSRNNIEQLQSANSKLCEENAELRILLDKKVDENAELKKEKSDITTKIEYCLNECEPMYGGRSCGKSAKQIYKMAFEYCLELLKGGAE